MRLPSIFRREPTFDDVAKHMASLPEEQIQYMSMLTKSASFGTNFLSAVKSSKTTSSEFLKLDPEAQLKVIRNASVVHACVTTLASAFQEAPLVIEQREDDGTWKRTGDEVHPYLEPFKANPDLSESEIAQYALMNIELTGKSFLLILRDGMGNPKEIWPLPSSWVTIDLADNFSSSPSRLIKGYTVRFNSSQNYDQVEGGMGEQEFYVPFADMIYTKFPFPGNLVDGMSPLMACSGYVGLEQKSLNYQSSSLENLNLPGLVLKSDRQLSEPQKKMLRSVLADKVGPKVANSAMMFGGKGMEVDMVNPLESFGWNDFHKLNESRICMTFKVPPIVIGAVIGLEETTGWASGDMREAKKWLYRNTVHGLWKMFATNIGRAFIPVEERETYRVNFDPNQVPELQEERGKLEERATALFNASMVTLNEAREMMLMKSVSGGDLFKTNLSNMYLPAESLAIAVVPDTQVTGPAPGTDEEDEMLEIEDDEAENEGK